MMLLNVVYVVLASFLIFFSAISHAEELHHSEAWQQLKPLYFSDRNIEDKANKVIALELPERVEDAAVIPVRIKSLMEQTPNHYIKTLYLIIDNNPQPVAAVFHISPTLGDIDLSTRIRMDSFSNVRVIAEMNDDSLYMKERFIIASGGCSAPSTKDGQAVLNSLGKIQIRMRSPIIGDETMTQVLISHPNANGLQMNGNTGSYIPAFYVTEFDIRYNGELLIHAETGFSLSETPSIRFNFIPQVADSLKVKITDSKSNVYLSEKVITD
jgi:sulfur-oxidizing protein SoxY